MSRPRQQEALQHGELASVVDESNVCKYDLNVNLFFSLASLLALCAPDPAPVPSGEFTFTLYPEYAEYVGLVGLPAEVDADAESKLVVLPVLSVRYIPGMDIDDDGPALFCRV